MKKNGVKILNYWMDGLQTVMFEYEILKNGVVIKSGIDVLDDSIDFEAFKTERERFAILEDSIFDEWNYIVSKPNINDISMIMQDCIKSTLESDSGLGCISKECFEEMYSEDEKKGFLKEIKQYCLDQYIEIKNNLGNIRKDDSAIVAYGFLPTCFDLTGMSI